MQDCRIDCAKGEQSRIVGMEHPEVKNRQENRIDKFIVGCLVLYDDKTQGIRSGRSTYCVC